MTQWGRAGNCEGAELASAPSALSRRAFMRRAGGLVLGASLAQIPETLDARGLVGVAEAQTVTFVEDTFNGLLAFATPGDVLSPPGGLRAAGRRRRVGRDAGADREPRPLRAGLRARAVRRLRAG